MSDITQFLTGGRKFQLFSSSGTFTWPPGIECVWVTLQAPGGAGGSGARTNGVTYAGGGGGAGELLLRVPVPRPVSGTTTVTIPAAAVGGAGVASGTGATSGTAGAAAGDASFGAVLAKGGLGGGGGVTGSSNGAGAAGGSQFSRAGASQATPGSPNNAGTLGAGFTDIGGMGGCPGSCSGTTNTVLVPLTTRNAGASLNTRAGNGAASYWSDGIQGSANATDADTVAPSNATATQYGVGGAGSGGVNRSVGSWATGKGGDGGPALIIVEW